MPSEDQSGASMEMTLVALLASLFPSYCESPAFIVPQLQRHCIALQLVEPNKTALVIWRTPIDVLRPKEKGHQFASTCTASNLAIVSNIDGTKLFLPSVKYWYGKLLISGLVLHSSGQVKALPTISVNPTATTKFYFGWEGNVPAVSRTTGMVGFMSWFFSGGGIETSKDAPGSLKRLMRFMNVDYPPLYEMYYTSLWRCSWHMTIKSTDNQVLSFYGRYLDMEARSNVHQVEIRSSRGFMKYSGEAIQYVLPVTDNLFVGTIIDFEDYLREFVHLQRVYALHCRSKVYLFDASVKAKTYLADGHAAIPVSRDWLKFLERRQRMGGHDDDP